MTKENICSCVDCENSWPVFKTLSHSELKHVNTSRFEAAFKPGEVIIKQGSPASNVVFLVKGMAKVYMEGQGDKNMIINISKPGMMVVGPGIYTDQRNMFSVSALNDVRACFIDKDVIKDLVHRNSKFAEKFIIDLSFKSQFNLNLLMSMTQKKMPGRVAEILLYLADSVFDSDEFTMLLSRQELADMSGMAKESVVRILKEFSNEGIIDSGCPRFRILDREKLEMISLNG